MSWNCDGFDARKSIEDFLVQPGEYSEEEEHNMPEVSRAHMRLTCERALLCITLSDRLLEEWASRIFPDEADICSACQWQRDVSSWQTILEYIIQDDNMHSHSQLGYNLDGCVPLSDWSGRYGLTD